MAVVENTITAENEGNTVPQTEINIDITVVEIVKIGEEHIDLEASTPDEVNDADTINSQRLFKCEKCNTEVHSKDALEAHNKTAHPFRELSRTECTNCGPKANDKPELQKHIKTKHLANRPRKEFMEK